MHIGVEQDFRPARKAHPAFRLSNVGLDALAARLIMGGSPVRWDKELPEVRRFYTEDPWGNRLELLANDEP